jgi:hypothetical protein
VVMFTPLFAGQSPWGVYLFFALFNFIGLIFGFFIEEEAEDQTDEVEQCEEEINTPWALTSEEWGEHEEVDIIYARAHVDGRMPWRVAKDMPKLTFEEITVQLVMYKSTTAYPRPPQSPAHCHC